MRQLSRLIPIIARSQRRLLRFNSRISRNPYDDIDGRFWLDRDEHPVLQIDKLALCKLVGEPMSIFEVFCYTFLFILVIPISLYAGCVMYAQRKFNEEYEESLLDETPEPEEIPDME